LDEVVDPQNFGAILRSAHFFRDVSVLVCSKNASPPSPVVSAASAGALERLPLYSTRDLPALLGEFREGGWKVLGACADDSGSELGRVEKGERTVLVVGSEGSGLRTLVKRACSDFVRVGDPGAEGVDSLNVSVTTGILLWHLLKDDPAT